MLVLSIAAPRAFAGGSGDRVGAYVECTSDDLVGQRFCAAVKEKIRNSNRFLLRLGLDGSRIGIHLASVDDGSSGVEGYSAAIAATVTRNDQHKGELYDGQMVYVAGRDRVNQLAMDL